VTHPAATENTKHSTASGRILELDALRGLAALAVVFFHFTTRYQELFGHRESLPLSISWGDYGVNLFFMLSGFVILMTLERTSDSVKFAWGRFTRLYPAYWAAVVLTFVVVMAFGLSGQQVSIRQAIVNLTMIQSLLGTPHVDGAYWSLQAELIFYCNMLLVYRLGAFRWPTATTAIWVSLAAMAVATQSLSEMVSPTTAGILSKVVTIASFKYIAMFGLGILIYDGRRRTDARITRLLAAGCCLAAIALRSGTEAMLIDAALAAILWMAVNGRLAWLNAKWLTFLGAISYTLYLTHQNIGYIVIRELEDRGVYPIVAIFVAFAVALTMAIGLHRFVERPSLQRLRGVDVSSILCKTFQRLVPRRPSPTVSTTK
tara:strand:+ start:47427 stop:48548 length:1122 start_codon:yes stop_codon:yes gene_type:complete